MKLKIMAGILAVLLGGMAIYYNQSTSGSADGVTAPKVENAK